MTATGSAPGKVMLFGEYAVLEGHRSLALCFDRRIRCTATPSERLQVRAPGVFEPVDLDPSVLDGACPHPDLTLLWPVLAAHAPRSGVSLTFEAGFPPTWGLGSSSASTLAAAGALRALAGASPDADAVFTEVWKAQQQLQGAASGYDVATQLHGGCVAYRMPGEAERLPDRPDLRWLVAWTGHKAKTGSMIRRVRESFPVGHPIYARIGALADDAIAAWISGAPLGPLLNAGHALLDELGAVPPEPGAIVRALQADPDVLGARMCGAGGGDSVLILARDPEYAGRAAEHHGLQLLPLSPEVDGLRLESSP